MKIKTGILISSSLIGKTSVEEERSGANWE